MSKPWPCLCRTVKALRRQSSSLWSHCVRSQASAVGSKNYCDRSQARARGSKIKVAHSSVRGMVPRNVRVPLKDKLISLQKLLKVLMTPPILDTDNRKLLMRRLRVAIVRPQNCMSKTRSWRPNSTSNGSSLTKSLAKKSPISTELLLRVLIYS